MAHFVLFLSKEGSTNRSLNNAVIIAKRLKIAKYCIGGASAKSRTLNPMTKITEVNNIPGPAWDKACSMLFDVLYQYIKCIVSSTTMLNSKHPIGIVTMSRLIPNHPINPSIAIIGNTFATTANITNLKFLI